MATDILIVATEEEALRRSAPEILPEVLGGRAPRRHPRAEPLVVLVTEAARQIEGLHVGDVTWTAGAAMSPWASQAREVISRARAKPRGSALDQPNRED